MRFLAPVRACLRPSSLCRSPCWIPGLSTLLYATRLRHVQHALIGVGISRTLLFRCTTLRCILSIPQEEHLVYALGTCGPKTLKVPPIVQLRLLTMSSSCWMNVHAFPRVVFFVLCSHPYVSVLSFISYRKGLDLSFWMDKHFYKTRHMDMVGHKNQAICSTAVCLTTMVIRWRVFITRPPALQAARLICALRAAHMLKASTLLCMAISRIAINLCFHLIGYLPFVSWLILPPISSLSPMRSS